MHEKALPAALAAQVDAMQAAAVAVGTTDTDVLRWINAFAADDLALPGGLDRGRAEVWTFMRNHLSRSVAGAHGRPLQTIGRVLLPPSDLDPVNLQLQLRGCLEGLAAHGYFRLPAPCVEAMRFFPRVGVVSESGGSDTAVFFAALLEVLIRPGARLRFCAYTPCRHLFLHRRVTQVFCSIRCQNRATQARFRDAHKNDAAERRHARYTTQVRRTHPKAKIARRPRRTVPASVHAGATLQAQPTATKLQPVARGAVR